MTYFAPYIDETGFHIPTYQDIVLDLVGQAQSIFGVDAYFEPDSMDYQYISILAARIYSSYQLAQSVYHNRTPVTASGIGLDAIVQINGLTRQGAAYSSAVVELLGTAGTQITNGVVEDRQGNRWDLPGIVTIPSGGRILVTVKAQKPGPLQVTGGQIDRIVTPVAGWNGVTNPNPSTPGQDVESDGSLRARQARSVALPSQTVFEGTVGAVLDVSGVTRAMGYENNSGDADANGIPAHSICLVVEGGLDADIAEAIYLHKTPGCGTYGSQTVNVASIYGFDTPIHFSRPRDLALQIAVTLKGFSGYTTAVGDAIKQELVKYLSGLQIGDQVVLSSLWYAASLAQPNPLSPVFSITSLQAGPVGGSFSSTDVAVAYDQAVRVNAENITLTVS